MDLERPVVQGVRSVKGLVLLRGQLDVPDPQAHRGLGGTDTPRNLVEWQTLSLLLSGHVPFGRFHSGKQATGKAGRIQSGRPGSNR
jgi:hypothetical protein